MQESGQPGSNSLWVVVHLPTAERICSPFPPAKPHTSTLCSPLFVEPQWAERHPCSYIGDTESFTGGWSHARASHTQVTSFGGTEVCSDVSNSKSRWFTISSDGPM